MEQSELLQRVAETLERLGVRYFVTGSVATIYYGEPRMTNDIDIVAAVPAGQVAALCRAFPGPEFYVDEEAARDAVLQGGQFNIIHPSSGLKVDVILPSDSPFDRSRFARARRLRPSVAYEASFASPEDVIIKKMDYYRAGGSEKHLRDIAGVLKISGAQLDRAYIEDWAARLGVDEIWQAVLERAREVIT
jgi:hypothetical protein